MCEYCAQLNESHIILELKNLYHRPALKYEQAVIALTKALGYDSERQQKEISPFRAVREAEAYSKDRVESHLLKLFNTISARWIGIEKASTDPFLLNNRIFIDPKSGKPLTKGQWKIIKRDILKVLNYIYAPEEERIATQALAMGKVLKGMSINDSLYSGYLSIQDAIDDTMNKLKGPLWRNTVTFAQQHAGELITNLTQNQYRKIHDTLQNGIENRINHRELRENLFDKFGEMNRDWRRIAETEIGTSMNNGQLITEMERAKPGETIFMKGISSSEACPFCLSMVNNQIVVLLPEPPVTDDQVMVNGEMYTAIWPGKNNYGRRRANWWVSAGTNHPFCRCTWVKHIPGFEDIDARFRASMEAAMAEGARRQKPIDDSEKLIKPTPWN